VILHSVLLCDLGCGICQSYYVIFAENMYIYPTNETRMHEPAQQGNEPNPHKRVSSPKVIKHVGSMAEVGGTIKSCFAIVPNNRT
jgi:hypothetical protein